MTVEPKYYPISEACHILEVGVYWLRWKEKQMITAGTFVRPDGSPLIIARSLTSSGTVGPASRRRYTLQDIEDMALLFSSVGVYKHPQAAISRIMRRISLYKNLGEEGE